MRNFTRLASARAEEKPPAVINSCQTLFGCFFANQTFPSTQSSVRWQWEYTTDTHFERFLLGCHSIESVLVHLLMWPKSYLTQNGCSTRRFMAEISKRQIHASYLTDSIVATKLLLALKDSVFSRTLFRGLRLITRFDVLCSFSHQYHIRSGISLSLTYIVEATP